MLKAGGLFLKKDGGDILLSLAIGTGYLPLSTLADCAEEKRARVFLNLCELVWSVRDHGILAFKISPDVVHYNSEEEVAIELKGIDHFPDAACKTLASRWNFPYMPPETWDPGIGLEWLDIVKAEETAVWAIGATMYQVNPSFAPSGYDYSLERYVTDLTIDNNIYIEAFEILPPLAALILDTLRIEKAERPSLNELIRKVETAKSAMAKTFVKEEPVLDVSPILEEHAQVSESISIAGTPRIHGYEIIKLLGMHGMTRIWLARKRKNEQLVALRTIAGNVDSHDIKRVQREIELAAALRHPHVVRFGHTGFADGQFYSVMEYIEGIDAQMLLQQRGGKVEPGEAIPIALQVLDALEYVHSQGIVHRNIKPSNILLTQLEKGWQAKLTGFDLAIRYQPAGLSRSTPEADLAGTPAFMPPEQLTNYSHPKPVSDIFALGATLYHLLTGQFVCDIGGAKEWYQQILAGEPVPIRKRDLSIGEDLADVIDKSVSKKADDRYQDAHEMKVALEKVWQDKEK